MAKSNRPKSSPPPGFKKVLDWEGKRIRTKRVMQNRAMRLPEGTTATVEAAHYGLELMTDPCPCCGTNTRISRLSSDDVELLPDTQPWPVVERFYRSRNASVVFTPLETLISVAREMGELKTLLELVDRISENESQRVDKGWDELTVAISNQKKKIESGAKS